MTTHEHKPAVVLLSGGLDSATCLALAASRGFACHALTFGYGQRHRCEIECAEALARAMGAASHRLFELDPAPFAASALTGRGAVPKDRDPVAAGGIPATYVPARNLVFLSIAVAYAETLDAGDVFIGVNAVDYSGYPDCRPEFIQAFAAAAALATKRSAERGVGVRIHTPLVDLSKAEIVRLGSDLGVDFAATTSCYDPADDADGVRACGRCEACRLRHAGFEAAGIADPTRYAGEPVGSTR
ncbi:MAG: 7-cyano-7-deazaguanine synthase QueC [Planctomycetota bacterium]